MTSIPNNSVSSSSSTNSVSTFQIVGSSIHSQQDQEVNRVAQEVVNLRNHSGRSRKRKSYNPTEGCIKKARRLHPSLTNMPLEELSPKDLSHIVSATKTAKIRSALSHLTPLQFLALFENLSSTQIKELHGSFSERHFETLLNLFSKKPSHPRQDELLRELCSTFSPKQLCKALSSNFLTKRLLKVITPTITLPIHLETLASKLSMSQISEVIPLLSCDQLTLFFAKLPPVKINGSYLAMTRLQKEEILRNTPAFSHQTFLEHDISTLQIIVAIKMRDFADLSLPSIISQLPSQQMNQALAATGRTQFSLYLSFLSNSQLIEYVPAMPSWQIKMLFSRLTAFQPILFLPHMSPSQLQDVIGSISPPMLETMLSVMSAEQIKAIIPHLNNEQMNSLIAPLASIPPELFSFAIGTLENVHIAAGLFTPYFSNQIFDHLSFLSLNQLSFLTPLMNSSQILKGLSRSDHVGITQTILRSATFQQRKDLSSEIFTNSLSFGRKRPKILRRFKKINIQVNKSLEDFEVLKKRFDSLNAKSSDAEKQSCRESVEAIKITLVSQLRSQLNTLLFQTLEKKTSIYDYQKAIPLLTYPGIDKMLFKLEKQYISLSSELTACLKKIDSGDSQSGVQPQLNKMISILGSTSHKPTIPISNSVAHDKNKVMELYEGARGVLNYLRASEEALEDLDITYDDLIAKDLTTIEKSVELGITNLQELKSFLES